MRNVLCRSDERGVEGQLGNQTGQPRVCFTGTKVEAKATSTLLEDGFTENPSWYSH